LKRLAFLLFVALICVIGIRPIQAMNQVQVQSNPWYYYYIEIFWPWSTKTTGVVQQTRYGEHHLETLSVYPHWIDVRSETHRGNILCAYYRVYANSYIPMQTTGLPGEYVLLRFRSGGTIPNSSNGFHSP
jgi:hypothetical protein